jgi:hypothetical protein
MSSDGVEGGVDKDNHAGFDNDDMRQDVGLGGLENVNEDQGSESDAERGTDGQGLGLEGGSDANNEGAQAGDSLGLDEIDISKLSLWKQQQYRAKQERKQKEAQLRIRTVENFKIMIHQTMLHEAFKQVSELNT